MEGTESIQLLNKREHDISGLTISYSKVVTILHELGVPYIIKSFKFDDVKKPPFIYINPNGRVPGK